MGDEYPIEKCDVKDKDSLEKFRTKRKEWLAHLKTDEHAINSLIYDMTWNDVTFRTLAYIAEIDKDSCLHNPLLSESLVHGYFARQVLLIRRLMDGNSKTISLCRLLKDIKENIRFFTRENFVAHDGLPYNYETGRQQEIEKLKNNGIILRDTSGPNAWGTSRQAHEIFDKLSGVHAKNRCRDDRISKNVIERLMGWLNDSDAEELVQWSHRFLAHSGNENERKKIDLASHAPSLDKIKKVLSSFIRISEIISAHLLFSHAHGSVVPYASFNKFEGIQSPLLTTADGYKLLHEHWEKLAKQYNDLLQGVIESLDKQVETA